MSEWHPQGWIGVDLDGTLAHYDTWRGEDHVGEPILPMLNRVKAWLAEGRKVKIVTARAFRPAHLADTGFYIIGPVHIPAIDTWCEKHLGQRLEVTCMKDYGMVALYDDRVYQVRPNQGTVVGEDGP